MAEITTPLSIAQLVGLVRHIAARFHEKYPGRDIDCIHLPTTFDISSADGGVVMETLGLFVSGRCSDPQGASVCFDDIKSSFSIPVPDMIWQEIYDVMDE